MKQKLQVVHVLLFLKYALPIHVIVTWISLGEKVSTLATQNVKIFQSPASSYILSWIVRVHYCNNESWVFKEEAEITSLTGKHMEEYDLENKKATKSYWWHLPTILTRFQQETTESK